MSRNYDNWEKLVGAVLRRENDRQLAYCESFSTCYSGDLSSRFSFDSAVEDADNFRFNPFVGDVHLPAGNSIDEQMDESRSSNWDVGFQPFNGTMPVMHDSVDAVGSPMLERVDSFGSEEEVPGIEGLQIIGDAKPGRNLLGCGFPVRGTFLCMFQWIRHYPDGTSQYIEGATSPDYVVTADDVDTFVSVECIPMDELGRQGDRVRIFANDSNKITCDVEMQEEIDGYISQGLATFKVLILSEDSEKWEPVTLVLRRSGFQVEVGKNTIISESYSKELLIGIPGGLSAQFFLTCSNGSSYPLSTNNDIRMRDTLVLTMRIFQTKSFDQGRKNEAGYIST